MVKQTAKELLLLNNENSGIPNRFALVNLMLQQFKFFSFYFWGFSHTVYVTVVENYILVKHKEVPESSKTSALTSFKELKLF